MNIFILPPMGLCGANSYIIASEKGSAALVDAPANADFVLGEIQRRGLSLKMILLTHGHIDHIEAAAQLQKKSGCKVYIHSGDMAMLTDGRLNLANNMTGGAFERVDNALPLSDGDILQLDEVQIKVMHTPGHTQGSVCYIAGDNMFSGDTLFRCSIGRTDFPGSDINAMRQSLKKLAAIDKDYTVYPGHEDMTSLDFEKENNYYLKRI